MKKLMTLIICFLLLFGVSGCTTKEEAKDIITYQNISASDAKDKLDSESDIILLDVRTHEEYETEHIPGSILIPLSELEDRAIAELSNKDLMIIVYCASGGRSKTASNILVNLEYTNVYNLTGGISAWIYEIEQ